MRAVTHVKKKTKIVYTFVKLSRPCAAILEKEKKIRIARRFKTIQGVIISKQRVPFFKGKIL